MAGRRHAPRKQPAKGCPPWAAAEFARLAAKARAVCSPPLPDDVAAIVEAARRPLELQPEAAPPSPRQRVRVAKGATLHDLVRRHGRITVDVDRHRVVTAAGALVEGGWRLVEEEERKQVREANQRAGLRSEAVTAAAPVSPRPAVEAPEDAGLGRLERLAASALEAVRSLARREQPAPQVHVYSPEPLPQPAPIVNVQMPAEITMRAAPTRTIVTARDVEGLVESTETHPLGLPTKPAELEPGSPA